ncbi:hypothetical protein OROGR_032856 [Orobanche gracilis]
MADRRPFFRFWQKPINRQPTTTTTTSPPTPKNQTPSPPPLATSSATPTAGSQPIGRQPTNTGRSPPNPTSTPTNETSHPKKTSPNEKQPTVTTLTSPKNETENTSQSPSSASTSSGTPQSRSPPLPLSPSRKSQTPSTPQRSPQPRSPSRLTTKQTPSNTPKERRPNSPSKESRQRGGATSSSYEAQTLASEEKETQPKIQVKSGGANHETNGVDDASFKHYVSKETPFELKETVNTTVAAQSTKKHSPTEQLDSSTISKAHEPLLELKAKKTEETKDVNEMVPATKIEANQETNKEAGSFPNPKSGSGGPNAEKSEIPSKIDEEISHTYLHNLEPTNRATSLPKKRIVNPGTHDKSGQTSGEHASLNKDIRDDIPTFVSRVTIGDPRRATNDRNVSIITLVGENRGASMQMGPNSFKEAPLHIHRGYKINPDESAETNTDGGRSSKKSTDYQPTEVYVNCNVQGINNSIVSNASIEEISPGVHRVVTRAPNEPIQSAKEISHERRNLTCLKYKNLPMSPP